MIAQMFALSNLTWAVAVSVGLVFGAMFFAVVALLAYMALRSRHPVDVVAKLTHDIDCAKTIGKRLEQRAEAAGEAKAIIAKDAPLLLPTAPAAK